MDPLTQALLHIALLLALPLTFIAMMVTYMNHQELWRPLIGNILFRKVKIPPDFDTVQLFRIGNHGEDVTTIEALVYSRERLERYIQKNSWFRRTDRRNLRRHYEIMFGAVLVYQDRLRAEEQRRAKAAKKKDAESHEQNKPIAEWRRILGVDAQCRDPKVIKTRYRKLVSQDHPDKGGKGSRMPELNRALDTARNELGFV